MDFAEKSKRNLIMAAQIHNDNIEKRGKSYVYKTQRIYGLQKEPENHEAGAGRDLCRHVSGDTDVF